MMKMKKFFAAFIMLVCATTMSVHATNGTPAGDGTKTNPYIIADEDDWNTFAKEANAATYWSEGVYTRLETTLSTDTMIGTDSHPFCGNFDGGGYNITLNISDDSEHYNALFHYVGNATIRNMLVSGTVSSNNPYASGLVGYVDDEATKAVVIDRCQVSVNVEGVTPVCGVIGYINAGLNATITITNTLFDGSFNGKKADTFFGGFVGRDGAGDLTIDNCLFNPSNVGNCNLYYSRTFVYETSGYYNLTNAYYKFVVQTYNQGIDATSMSGADLVQVFGDEWFVSGSTAKPSLHGRFMKDASLSGVDTHYSYSPPANPIRLDYTITDLYGDALTEGTHYTVLVNGEPKPSSEVYPHDGPGQLTLTALGTYTITFKANEVLYHGHITKTVYLLTPLPGSGTSNDPYIIDSDKWPRFVQHINVGWRADKHYKLSDSFDNTAYPVTEMVGLRDEYPFRGVFDGNGKTLHVNLSSEEAGTGVNEQGVAPFHYIKGATIKNLDVEGAIASASSYTAGLVGFADGTNTIDDCHVSVTIHQNNDYAGGIVGHGLWRDTTTIMNSIFDGTIVGVTESRANIGGIWGWSGYNAFVTIQNCLENGTYTNISSMHPMGLMKNYGSISGSYYLHPQIGNPGQACTLSGYKRAYTEAPATPMFKQIGLIDGNSYWLSSTSHMREIYYCTGEAIPLAYNVKDDKGNTLTEGTDYTVLILDSNGDEVAKADLKDVGDYKLAFTAAGACAGSDTLTFNIGYNKVAVTSETTTMEDNVYELSSNVTISSRITISGDVELYLNEGCTLTASQGIKLSEGNKLTIYGPGTLNTTGDVEGSNSTPGIGAYRFGTLVINGGTINATGGLTGQYGAAGIGGEIHNGSGGSLTINGGVVNARGGNGAAGIGGGSNNWSGSYGVPMDSIIINGGQVTAIGGYGADVAIGRGKSGGNGGILTLNWTNPDDFINAGSYGGFNKIVLLKTFIDTSDVLHTPENPDLNGLKLMPYEGEPTGTEEIKNEKLKITNKVLRDGQLYILRDGKVYNAQGALIAAEPR